MANTAELKLEIGLVDKASTPMSKIADGLGKLGKLAGGVALGGILGLGVGLAGVVTTGLGFNNAMEQASAKINAFTKDADATAAILEMVRERAAKTPFAFEEMANAAAALGPAAKASGVPLEELIAQAEILAASNPAEGLEGAVFSLKEALGGDFLSVVERFNLPKQRLKELKDEGVPALDALRTAMAEMGYDADLVSNMANTASGRWSTLMDTFTTLASVITAPIFEGVSKGMGDLQVLLDANMPLIQSFATVLGEQVAAAMTWIATVGIPGLIAGWTAVQPLLAAVGDILVGTVIPAFEQVVTWVTQNIDLLTTIGTTVGVVVAAFATLSTIVGVIASVATAITGMGAAITTAGGIVAAIIAVLGGPLTIALGAVALAVGALTLAWNTNFLDIQGKTKAVVDWWTTTAQPAIATAFTAVVTQVGIMRDAWDRDFETVRSVIQTMREAWDTAVAAVGIAIDLAKGYIASFRDEVNTKIAEAVGFFEELPGKITAAVSSLPGLLVQTGKDLIQGLIDGALSMVGSIGSALVGIVTGAVDAARNAIRSDSPSKLTRDVIGKPLAEGIVVGINEKMPEVKKALVGWFGKFAPDVPKAAQKLGKESGDAFGDGLIVTSGQKMEQVKQEITRRFGTPNQAVKRSAYQFGKTVGDAIKEGVIISSSEDLERLKEQLTEGLADPAMVADAMEKGKVIGKAYADGMAAGVRAGAGAFASAVSGITGGAPFGTGTPSRGGDTVHVTGARTGGRRWAVCDECCSWYHGLYRRSWCQQSARP